MDSWPLDQLRHDPAAKRALWPQLRALRKRARHERGHPARPGQPACVARERPQCGNGDRTARLPFPWTRGIFIDCLRAGYPGLAMERDGLLVGYGVLSIAADEAHVLNICIDPLAQSRGLGRQLLRALVQLAADRGAQRVFLEVRPSNTPAGAVSQRRIQRDRPPPALLPGCTGPRGCGRDGDRAGRRRSAGNAAAVTQTGCRPAAGTTDASLTPAATPARRPR